MKRILLLLLLIPLIAFGQTRAKKSKILFDHEAPRTEIRSFQLASFIDNITLSWVYSGSGARGFYIYKGTTGAPQLLDSVSASTFQYIDGGTNQDTLYTYFVSVYDSSWTALDSTESLSAYEKIFPPVFVALGDTISADLIMGVITELAYDSVRIFKGVLPYPTTYFYTFTSDGTYIDTPLVAGVYHYRGIAYRGGRTSDYSSDYEASVITLRAPETPVLLGGTESITINVAEDLVDSVRIYRGTVEGESTLWIASVAPTASYVDAPLTAGTYYYRTKNYKSGILSDYSLEASAIATAPGAESYILTEDSYYILMEDGYKIILEVIN